MSGLPWPGWDCLAAEVRSQLTSSTGPRSTDVQTLTVSWEGTEEP